MLDTAMPAHNRQVIALSVNTVGREWRELSENFPGVTDTGVKGGRAERQVARAAVCGLVLDLCRIAMAVASDDFHSAAKTYDAYRSRATSAATRLKLAERWSLLNPVVREVHFAALKRLAGLTK